MELIIQYLLNLSYHWEERRCMSYFSCWNHKKQPKSLIRLEEVAEREWGVSHAGSTVRKQRAMSGGPQFAYLFQSPENPSPWDTAANI